MSERPPLVSVGVPVFNGEAGLSRCLDSLLQQDYANLEIIISDNGSTDETPSICERYVRQDRRVRYTRSEENCGSSWNFNRVFELSSGKYFMWAAHDDDRELTFVTACVRRLEECPDAVLCQGHTAVYVEGCEDVLYVARLDTLDRPMTMVARYNEALSRLSATAIYGLFRRSAMASSRRFESVIATDIAFLQEMAIYGRIIQVPRILFRYRARRYWNTIHQDAKTFLGVPHKSWWYVPFVMLFLAHAARIRHAPIGPGMKLRLWCVLVFHEMKQLTRKLAIKLFGLLCPVSQRDALARSICRAWMTNPNIDVVSPGLYFERVCKPQLGWWR